jgi:hypothetical protein
MDQCQGGLIRHFFKPIHGIVRQADSLRFVRAQHMKKYVQITEN